MKRTAALTLILVVLLLGAFSSSAGARDTGQLNPSATFHSLALLAARPASGQDLYENIHEYMWKSVYVMGTVDHALPQTDDGQFVFIRTWQGDGHKVFPPDVDFAFNESPAIHFDNVPIVGDAIISLPPLMKFPHGDFELVGTVCGIQKFHSFVQPGAAFPVICIPSDGQLRIRKAQVFINWIEE